MKPSIALLLTAVTALALPAAAQASIITFTDREAFNAAVGAVNLIIFDDLPGGRACPPSPLGGPPCSLTVGDVTFTTTTEPSGPDIPEEGPQLTVGTHLAYGAGDIPGAAGDFTLRFIGPAIGLDIFNGCCADPPPYEFLFREADGTTRSEIVRASLTGTFFGAISDTGFSGLDLFSIDDDDEPGRFFASFSIDNVATAAPRSVPEPSAIALLASAIGLSMWTVRRRRFPMPGCRSNSAPRDLR